MSIKKKLILVLVSIYLVTVTQASPQEKLPTYRLTVQIHESPALNSYYIFCFANIEFARSEEQPANRSLQLFVPNGNEPIQGLSAYWPHNQSSLSILEEETDQGTRLTITTDAPSCELRYYVHLQAREVGSQRDHLLAFSLPKPEAPVSGVTISINWPNWKYDIHKILPKGAERTINPLFETDPYKVVSYYWYFSGTDAPSKFPGQISVSLRSAEAISRVNRNQSILVLLVVVCVPLAIFIVAHPPKRAKEPEREKRFRITEPRGGRRVVRRIKYKVK